MFNINLLRVNIAALLFFIAIIVATSCNYSGNRHTGFSHSVSYICEDTLSSFNLSLYARLSSNFNYNALPVVVLVTTPLGEKYADTLMLPITVKGVEVKNVQSGIWTDYEWNYRRDIVFNNKGKWVFTIKQDSLSLKLEGVGTMGVKITESKKR